MKTYEFGEYSLDTESRKLCRQSGEIVTLTPRVFDLLVALVESNGRVLSKDELLETVWADCIVEESNLSQSIFVLRKALNETASNPRFIRTIPAQGYRFIAPVKIESGNSIDLDPKSNNKIQEFFESSSNFEENEKNESGSIKPKSGKSYFSGMIIAGTLLVLLLMTGWYFLRPKHNPITSIAVIPFFNSNNDPDLDYLSDGLTENINNKLARLPKLKVLARSVVAKYKGQEIDPLKVGNELGVGAVLVGSLTQEGEIFNIRLELIESASGNLLWGESYKRKATDLLGLQEEIARRTTEKLNLKLTPEEQTQFSKSYTENAEAYSLYLKGRFFWRKYTKEGYEKAIEYYNQALELDHNYAIAYAGIADCYTRMASADLAAPKEIFPKARTSALRALEIDENLAEAHLALAWIKVSFDWDWAGAEKEFQRAIELNPNHAQTHYWYWSLLLALGKFDEAVVEVKRANELDPIYSNSGMALTLYHLRRFDEAIEHNKKALEITPNSINTLWWLQRVYAVKGMKKEALTTMEMAVRKAESPNSTNTATGISFAKIDFKRDYDSAQRQMIQIYLEESKRQYVSPYDVAASFALLKDKTNAIIWLENAFEDRSTTMHWLAIDPVWDVLHPDPRFQEILKKMNLENVKPAPSS